MLGLREKGRRRRLKSVRKGFYRNLDWFGWVLTNCSMVWMAV